MTSQGHNAGGLKTSLLPNFIDPKPKMSQARRPAVLPDVTYFLRATVRRHGSAVDRRRTMHRRSTMGMALQGPCIALLYSLCCWEA